MIDTLSYLNSTSNFDGHSVPISGRNLVDVWNLRHDLFSWLRGWRHIQPSIGIGRLRQFGLV